MGREVVVAVTKGRLDLGTWEQIFYGEFDGRRKKRVLDQDHRRMIRLKSAAAGRPELAPRNSASLA